MAGALVPPCQALYFSLLFSITGIFPALPNDSLLHETRGYFVSADYRSRSRLAEDHPEVQYQRHIRSHYLSRQRATWGWSVRYGSLLRSLSHCDKAGVLSPWLEGSTQTGWQLYGLRHSKWRIRAIHVLDHVVQFFSNVPCGTIMLLIVFTQRDAPWFLSIIWQSVWAILNREIWKSSSDQNIYCSKSLNTPPKENPYKFSHYWPHATETNAPESPDGDLVKLRKGTTLSRVRRRHLHGHY